MTNSSYTYTRNRDGYDCYRDGQYLGHLMRGWSRTCGNCWRAADLQGRTADYRTREQAARSLQSRRRTS